MAAAFSGRDPYLYAALKSLPLAITPAEEEAVAAAGWEAQAALAGALLQELEGERSGWPTSMAQDAEWLAEWKSIAEAAGTACGAEVDERLAAAVQYRLQRKLLVSAGAGLLRRFLDA